MTATRERILVALLVLLAPTALAQGEPSAPEFAAPTLADGATLALSDLRGNAVVVNLWATWCTACVEEMPSLQALHAARNGSGLTVVGVSIDERDSIDDVRAYVEDLGVTYPILLDPDERFSRAFRTTGVPETFLLDRDGRVVHRWVGPFDPVSNETRALVDSALEGTTIESTTSGTRIGLAIAVAAGAMSFLSPCVFPLLPSYVAVVTGMSLDELTHPDARARVRRRVLVNGAIFVAGFTTVFLLMGASATMIGGALRDHKRWLVLAGGLLLITFGLLLMGILRIPGTDRELRFHVQRPGAHRSGVFLVGLAFGAGWTPCIGPILAGILTLAASSGSLVEGLQLLLAYSIGLAIPFLAAALGLRHLLPRMSKLGAWLPRLQKASGVLLIAMGVLLLTGGLTLLTTWLARWTPHALRGIG